MKLVSLELRDFLSHHHTDVDLGDARLVTLVGSNGAGKSALLDAVAYALYDTARAKTDQLVRIGATEMSVAVTFDLPDGTYRVLRGRSSRGAGKSRLEFQRQTPSGWVPLSGDDIRGTEQAIADKLRMDADAFLTAAFLRQGDLARFVEATPAERKRVLATVLGLDVYADALALAKEDRDQAQADIAAATATIERVDARLAEVETQARLVTRWTEARAAADAGIAEARGQQDAAQESLRALERKLAAAEAAQAEAVRLEAQVREQQERWRRAAADQKGAEELIARAIAVLEHADTVEASQAGIEAARAAVADADRRSGDLDYATGEQRRLADELASRRRAHEDAVAAHRRSVTSAERLVADLEAHAAGLTDVMCPKCMHVFAADPSGVAERLAAARTALASVGAEPAEPLAIARTAALLFRAEQRVRECTAKAAGVAEARDGLLALERLAARSGEMDAARASLEEGRARRESARAEKAAAEEAGKAAGALHREAAARAASGESVLERQRGEQAVIDAATAAIAGLERERAEAERELARAEAAEAEVRRLTDERAGHERKVADYQVALARARKLVDAFSITGIPSRVIESVLPELAASANEVLAELRPGMQLELRAQRAKASGKGVVEALDLVVRDEAGERLLGLFSGGERTSVSLALAIAISRLVARRSGTAIRTLVVDEPDGLDAEARRAFCHQLRAIAHRRDLERVLLVSHHEDLAEIGDLVIRAEKRAGVSHVTDGDGNPLSIEAAESAAA